ncbi:MAG TPA: YdcF family protein [Aliidongia sp.]|nr:YdcF family protein [Aliidongia sp.]
MIELGFLVRALPVPPLSLFLLMALGLVLGRFRPRLGRRLVGLAMVAIFLLCLPVVSKAMLRTLETRADAVIADAGGAQAIIVLSADIERTAPEYGGPSIGELTLVRLRYAARLARRLDLPILVTGGQVGTLGPPIAPLMAEVLKTEFGLDAKWVEDASRNTYENAAFSARLLRADGVRSALLVTHSWHMPRSLLSFAQAGFPVRAAPTDFTPPFLWGVEEFLPSARAFEEGCYAIHEWIGLVWYRFSGS